MTVIQFIWNGEHINQHPINIALLTGDYKFIVYILELTIFHYKGVYILSSKL